LLMRCYDTGKGELSGEPWDRRYMLSGKKE
jgi:hypothetical protein